MTHDFHNDSRSLLSKAFSKSTNVAQRVLFHFFIFSTICLRVEMRSLHDIRFLKPARSCLMISRTALNHLKMIRLKIVLVCDHRVISCQLLQSPKLSFLEDYTLLSFFLCFFSFPCNLEYITEQGRDDLLQVLTSCSGALSSFVVVGWLPLLLSRLWIPRLCSYSSLSGILGRNGGLVSRAVTGSPKVSCLFCLLNFFSDDVPFSQA